MFDMGFLELLIIGVVGLLVLGPERLPKAARTMGLWIGKIKRTVSGMQREISAQLEAEELRQKLNEQQKKLDDSVNQVKRGVESIGDEPASSRHNSKANSSADAGSRGQDVSGKGNKDTEEADKKESYEAKPTPAPEKRLDDALSRARTDTTDDDRADKDASSR
ncbi:Sec-independent protein translocase protein TatB [Halomonas korlensis]|uniref:Sec-independent protein translocase protein TatB n=1 Tax=Halomonas korlensis TaxID=463301 RepID=A0A1I7HDW7_9GAMM|nr:Sec-independent protein translocase protein TatB [Halomonas korlensis]SFU58928.1 sec-independent protein translocase protein TatB [Halomonas korlensis]